MTMHRTLDPSPSIHELPTLPGVMVTARGARWLAVLRIASGFVFLWAFLDKTFGWNYATPSASAWIHGGSPTEGFLSHVEVGPLQGLFHSLAGNWLINTLFMAGLLGIGVALISGVALRLAALCGAAMMAMMWFAEFPLAQHTSAGAPSGSANPLTDSHVIYAVVLITLAATYAGSTWGLGARWARLPIVSRHGWLR